MRTVVVYESMYGNTRKIAQAIAAGLNDVDTIVIPVAEADPVVVRNGDLLVIGAPTHVFGLSRPQTRVQAVQKASQQPAGTLVVEPGAAGVGVREWLPTVDLKGRSVAVFDTRVKMAVPTGHATSKIRRALRGHYVTLICPPEGFFVTKQSTLVDGELDRARTWGAGLRSLVQTKNITP